MLGPVGLSPDLATLAYIKQDEPAVPERPTRHGGFERTVLPLGSAWAVLALAMWRAFRLSEDSLEIRVPKCRGGL